jgi:hypothetical protein
MRKKVTVLIVSLFVGLAFVAIGQAKKPQRAIANGKWGGQHIQISITNGSAQIEYDCANGTITGPLKIDSHGRFALRGIHNIEHGGPVRDDENQKGEPAKYSGWTDGKKMTLTVTLVNSKTEIGTFQLTRGSEGRVFKCR